MRARARVELCLGTVAALAGPLLSAIAGQAPAREWPTYRGAWFEVRYPPGFLVRPSEPHRPKLDQRDLQGFDSAFFTAPDGTVQFYVFSPPAVPHLNRPESAQLLNICRIEVRRCPVSCREHIRTCCGPERSVSEPFGLHGCGIAVSPQWNGEPTDIEVDTKTEVSVSTKATNARGKRVRWVTLRAKSGRYVRSFVDTEDTTTNTRRVFGIRYRDRKAYARWTPAYKRFKRSLVRYAD